MSEKKHEKVSLLDLPGFGSTIGTLRKELRKQFNWPIEMNFAALKNNPRKNVSSIFTSYKSLIDDWANHMKNWDNNDHKNTFTGEMENNLHLNFTKYIKADMKTFLIANAGKYDWKVLKLRSLIISDHLTNSSEKIY